MYQAFNLMLDEGDLSQYSEYASSSIATFQNGARRSLGTLKNGVLDAAAMEEDWFGTVDADVFISHSHADIGLANRLASILEGKLGLRAFVDYNVWGYADDLLREIDDKHCKNDDGYYNYQSRNRSTSNVHLMLSAAINKMIDKCELVLFLNTENSISSKSYVQNGKETTASPWIYSELVATKFIRKQLRRPKLSIENYHQKRAFDSTAASIPNFAFPAYLSHLTPLAAREFNAWCQSGKTKTSALDLLYSAHSE